MNWFADRPAGNAPPVSFGDGWGWYALAFGLAVQTSTAATSVLAVGAVLWAATHPRQLADAWIDPVLRPVLWAMAALWASILIGLPVALLDGREPWQMLLKHLPFVFVFLVVGVMRTPERRTMLLIGFVAGAALALGLSLYSAAIGHPVLNGSPDDYNTFRKHSEHNIFVGLAAFLVAIAVLDHRRSEGKWWWLGWLFFWLASYDVLHLVQGRTGQVVFLPMLLWVLASLLRSRRFVLAAVTAAVALAATLPGTLGKKSAVESGIVMAQKDIATYQEGRAKTPVAYRLEFARTSWQLILERPILGYGTGGFAPAYAAYVRSRLPGQETTQNPHNDYLFYWIEGGLPGVLAVLALYAAGLLTAWRVGGQRGICLAALIVVWSVAGLASSMLLDHPTRYAFAALLAALATGPLAPLGRPRTIVADQAEDSEVTRLRSP